MRSAVFLFWVLLFTLQSSGSCGGAVVQTALRESCLIVDCAGHTVNDRVGVKL